MKKIENWLERSALAAVGMFLTLTGAGLLDCVIKKSMYLSIWTSSTSPLMVCSVGAGMMMLGVVFVYIAYRKWKSGNIARERR